MYKIGETVEIHRRIDPRSTGANAAREWVRAQIHDISLDGETFYVEFGDGYTNSYTKNGLTGYNKRYLRKCNQPNVTFAKAMGISKKKKLHDNCPKCGNPGRFVLMALVCPVHGVWAGC